MLISSTIYIGTLIFTNFFATCPGIQLQIWSKTTDNYFKIWLMAIVLLFKLGNWLILTGIVISNITLHIPILVKYDVKISKKMRWFTKECKSSSVLTLSWTWISVCRGRTCFHELFGVNYRGTTPRIEWGPKELGPHNFLIRWTNGQSAVSTLLTQWITGVVGGFHFSYTPVIWFLDSESFHCSHHAGRCMSK